MAEIMKAGKAGIITIKVGAIEANCYLLFDRKSKQAFIIDPGGDAAMIEEAIKSNGLKGVYIVNTHGHFDHVSANDALKDATGASIALHGADVKLLAEAHEHAALWGVKISPQPGPDIIMKDGSTLQAGSVTLDILHTPGHTPGGVCLYYKDAGVIFTGDTLFAGSIGRTDLEGGSADTLLKSIKNRLLPLADNVIVFPGHGPASTIGEEKEHNPFVANMAI